MLRFVKLLILLVVLFETSECKPDENFENLSFIFINGDNIDTYEYIGLNETQKLLDHPFYHNDRPTVLYGYGHTEDYNFLSTRTIIESYIERGDHNILVLEWVDYNHNDYHTEAMPICYKIGDIVGKTLLQMKSLGFNTKTFHLVGHSLGSHLVAFIGRSFYEASGKTEKITRVTGLDPSSPYFYGADASPENPPICKNDATFVDIIHTDYTFFGPPEKTGTVDFWPNGGKDQPECPPGGWNVYEDENFCSHSRSWIYYAESVRLKEQKTFKSISCSSWDEFVQNACDGKQETFETFMGIDADARMTGNYFLQTNTMPPYDRGDLGKIYTNLTSI